MGLEGVFGLASIGKGALTRDFAMFSANYTRSAMGHVMSLHHHMPMMPHFSSGMPAVSAPMASHHYNQSVLPMYQIMQQQLDFQQQQLEFQKQQQNSNHGQVGLIRDMLTNFDNSMRSMMEIISKVVTQPPTVEQMPQQPPQYVAKEQNIKERSRPLPNVSFQSPVEATNVIHMNTNKA